MHSGAQTEGTPRVCGSGIWWSSAKARSENHSAPPELNAKTDGRSGAALAGSEL